MKKLLNVAAVAMALCGLMLTSCASSGDKADAPVSVHPRSYTFDVIDTEAGASFEIPFNSYGPNYQMYGRLYSLVKKDKPQAGDTVTFKGKATSEIDIPALFGNVVDSSAQANYWTILTSAEEQDFMIKEDVKAGEPFEFEVTVTLDKDVKGAFDFIWVYDMNEHPEYAKIGTAAKISLERVCESTDTSAEVPAAPHKQLVEVDLNKYAAFMEIATNHPWVNGAQDMSVISNYEAGPEVTAAYGEDLPVAGDVMHFHYKATADQDISKIYIRPVDRSAAANYWKELGTPNEDGSWPVMVENVVAGEPFEVDMDIAITDNAVAAVNLCIWYDVGDAEGPAICKIVRD